MTRHVALRGLVLRYLEDREERPTLEPPDRVARNLEASEQLESLRGARRGRRARCACSPPAALAGRPGPSSTLERPETRRT